MNQWQIGDVKITRIVEMEIAGGTKFILPDATREACVEYDWMQPHFMDGEGNLIMSIHALIVDTTRITRVPQATMRRQLKEFEDSKRPIIREKNIGSAIIIQSAVVRGAYTALRWISPQPAPNKAFSSMEAAARWCVEGIESDGQVVPIAAYAVAKLANGAAGRT